MGKKLCIRRSICAILLSPFSPIGATGEIFVDDGEKNTIDITEQDLPIQDNQLVYESVTTNTELSNTIEVVVLDEKQQLENSIVQTKEPIIVQSATTITTGTIGSGGISTLGTGGVVGSGGVLGSGALLTGTTTTSGQSIGLNMEDEIVVNLQKNETIDIDERLEEVRKQNEGLCKKSTIHCLEKVLDENAIEVTIIEDDESGSYYDEETGTLYEYDKKPKQDGSKEIFSGSGTIATTVSSGSVLSGSVLSGSVDSGSGSFTMAGTGTTHISTGAAVYSGVVSSGGVTTLTNPVFIPGTTIPSTGSDSVISNSSTTGSGEALTGITGNEPTKNLKFIIPSSKKITVSEIQERNASKRSTQSSLSLASNTPASVSFKKDTWVESKYGKVGSFDDIQVMAPNIDTVPTDTLSSILIGNEEDHLLFSQPTTVVIPIEGVDDGTEIAVSVFHYGQEKYNNSGLSMNPNTQCDTEGNATLPSTYTVIENGVVTFYTCSASTFVVSYIGGATLDNFADNNSLPKTITVGAGGAITDLNILVDFQPIDGEDPAAFGTTNAYSNEVSMTLESPTGTVISILDAGTYTNNGAANRAAVTFDDTAGAAPTNLPIDGTFTPSALLSAFNGEDSIGDWIFTISDNANQDGVILYEVSLELTDDNTCGNSIIEGAEGCDDGGTTPGDGCDASCLVEDTFACNTSGPGAENEFGCASGLCDQTEAIPTCEPTNTCGNNTLETGEECDDGNTADSDGCSTTCTIQYCSNGVIDMASSSITILSEDFESDNGTTQTSGTEIITALTHIIIYENTGVNGRVQYGTNAQQNSGGGGAVTLDVTPTGTFVTNRLIVESDLAAFVGSTDLELLFDWTDHGDEDQAEDIVQIRGSDSDSRIQIYDFNANTQVNGTYRTITVDIDSTLSTNSQIPTDTFQIRFGQNDNFTAISNTTNDGISLDNIVVTGSLSGPAIDEVCDDENLIDGDGCTSSCEIQPGYVCVGEPSLCTNVSCGNGVIDGSDVCDDGNTTAGDGCSDVCQIETDYLCSGEPSICNFCASNDIIKGTTVSSIGSITQTILFSNFTSHTYSSTPIVLMTPTTDANTNNYSLPIITSVTTTSVTISSCVDAGDPTCDSTLNNDDFALFVVDTDAAACSDNVEAGTIAVATDGSDTAFTFVNSFTNTPYVFTTPQTSSQGGNIAAHAWVDDGSLSINGGDFVGCVHQAGNAGGTNFDLCTTGQPNETLGRFAVDPALFTYSGFQLGTQNIGNSTWTPITFSPIYTQSPAIMVTQNSDNGGQDPQYAWARDVAPGTADIRYCEADAGGVCNSHTGETVRWFALKTESCGNGEITGIEVCDDGNTTNSDGCSDICQIESGYECVGEPSVCSISTNDAPTDITLSGNSIIENNGINQVIGDLSTTDADSGDTHTYTFGCAVPLPDEDFFTLSGSQMLTATGFNFEIPFDQNTNNNYEICILTDDSNGGTYEEAFTITILDEYEEICIYVGSGVIFNPIPVSSDGNIVATQALTGLFQLEDLNGSNTGYYTTLSIGGFNGALGNFMPATIAEIRNTNPITTISGSLNPDVELDTALNSFIPFDTPVTYLFRNTGVNNGRTGYYSSTPTLRVTIPEYQAVDTYSATITYTLYEN